ncbi:MAG TPA: hypothetical protein VHO01_02340 [Jatrophihabitans sp.]|nr:hypothetical protein [Jatrophihabitans sp.]
MSEHGKHEAADSGVDIVPTETRASFGAEVLDAVTPRTVLMVVAVLLLQLGFILSYVGAFHAPKPHRIPIGVVAPGGAAGQLVGQLNAIAGRPVDARAVASTSSATGQLRHGTLPAALVVDPSGNTDTLLVSSGGGTSVSQAITQVITAVEAKQQRSATVQDVVPLQPGDGRGLTGFYLVIGWIVGGYLMAALLGVARGARPATPRRAVIRLLSVLPYALLSGIGGAWLVGPVLHALTGHFLALAALGTLLVITSAAVTMALQVLLGVIGIGLTVLVFVVLGNPSAGGAYQPSVLPGFWRTISYALPNGAGTDTVRRIMYFGSRGITGHLAVIAGWAIAGVLVTLAVAVLRQRRGAAEPA